jgi:multidrug efflux pump subunit AcrB
MMAIPISVLIGLTLLDLSGFGLQQMSIAGLIIALGLLVDNSIAVVENIVRFLEMGYSGKEAAIKGTSEIGWALVSSTLTTILAFFPMIILPGPTGDFIRSLAVVVVYTLMASLIIALTFTPYMGSVILKLKKRQKKEKLIQRFINRQYPLILRHIMNWPKATIALTTVIFIASVSLIGVVGISFFPKAEKAQLLIDVNTPEGTNLGRTDQAVKFVESELEKIDEVINIASNIGHGNPQVYYNRMPRNYAANHGQVYVILEAYDNERMNELVKELRNRFEDYAGAKLEVKEFIQGPPIEAPIAVKVIGNDIGKLKRISSDVERYLESSYGVINVDNPIREKRINLEIDINRQKASILGVLTHDIDQAVRINMAGMKVGQYQDAEGEYYDMIIRNPDHHALDMNDFEKVFIPSIAGEQIKLSHVADFTLQESLIQIDHYNMDRVVTVTADVETEKASVFDITDRVDTYLASYDFPEGVSYKIGGEQESRTDSFGNMGQALIVALIGIFAILVLQFKSFTQPLIIYAAIPLSVTGSFIALFITGHSFSFMAFVGLTSLVGIVVNDSIVLVDYANQIRATGNNLLESVIEAGKTRFMPIVLTTLTTVGGLLPLTLRGGDMWAPMGWAIIGGLVLSTFLSLLIVPLLYNIFTVRKTG